MSKVTVTRHVAFTPDQVYAIASDVASYREFLPLMKSSVVFNKEDLGGGRENFEAEMTVSYKKLGISETIHSRVAVDAKNRTVTARSDDKGPMKHLDATWRIEAAPRGGANIVLDIDYALKSKSLQFLLSGMLDLVMRKLLSAFEERAKRLYGVSA
jgi:coenzyme Q-binding protein COQ10